MRKILFALVGLALVGVTGLAVHQSARLHQTEIIMDGLHGIRLRAADVWGELPLPHSLPDVTEEAAQRAILPASWAGKSVRIGRYRAGDLAATKASVSVTLFDLSPRVCADLLPRLHAPKERDIILLVTPATCATTSTTALQIALTTPAPHTAPVPHQEEKTPN